jgi:hypothetical protein
MEKLKQELLVGIIGLLAAEIEVPLPANTVRAPFWREALRDYLCDICSHAVDRVLDEDSESFNKPLRVRE